MHVRGKFFYHMNSNSYDLRIVTRGGVRQQNIMK